MKPIAVTDELTAYMEGFLPTREGVLADLEAHAERESVPIVGPHEGHLLSILARAGGAKRMLELGTATGYSGLWLLRGGGAGSFLTTVEMDPARAALARDALSAAGDGTGFEVLEGDALEVLEGLGGEFDLCFNDLLNSLPSESAVERMFELCVARTRPGGLLLADNALRRGEVLRPQSQGSRNVAAYNRLAARHPRIECVIVPIRDGLSISVVR